MMANPKPNPEWLELWEERGRAVRKVLGDTTPPGQVIPFRWDKYTIDVAVPVAQNIAVGN